MYENITVVSKERVLELINSSDAVIVNVLGKQAFDENHILNSISMPLNRLESDGWKSLPKDKLIITYCHSQSCNASKRAASILKDNGFPNVAAYEGGISEWVEHGLPTEGSSSKKVEAPS
jgi:rhodanese-related sulfurtransferase